MTRKEFLKVSGLTGFAALPACESLKELEKMPESTGIQGAAVIYVLAKYRATKPQQQQARRIASQVYIKRALTPAYENQVKTIAKKRDAKIARAVKSRPRPSAPAPKPTPKPTPTPAPDPDPDPVVEKISVEAAREKEAATANWYAIAAKATGNAIPANLKIEARPNPQVPVQSPLSSALARDAQRFLQANLAVRVAAAGVAAEKENPSAVTVMNYDTRKLDLASEDAYVLKAEPGAGKAVNLDGSSAVYTE